MVSCKRNNRNIVIVRNSLNEDGNAYINNYSNMQRFNVIQEKKTEEHEDEIEKLIIEADEIENSDEIEKFISEADEIENSDEIEKFISEADEEENEQFNYIEDKLGADSEEEIEEVTDEYINSALGDSFKAYLKEIGKKPLLTREEEVDLLTKVKNGDAEAKKELVERNLRLVVSVAKHYSGAEILDLVQEGNLGLMKAVEKFDLSKETKFSTYAVHWIRQAVGRYLMNNGRSIRLPVHAIEQINRIKNVKTELAQELRREPLPSEISDRLEETEHPISEGKVIELLGYINDMISLDQSVQAYSEEQDTTIMDFIADTNEEHYPEVALEKKELGETIHRILEKTGGFSPRERYIIYSRFGLVNDGQCRTLDEIGQELGLTRERVRQIEGKVLKKLERGRYSRELRQFL